MSHKTQCPRCHTIYPMPADKLGDDKARANCGKCRHTFFLNAHLVNESTQPEPIQNNKESFIHNALTRPKKPKVAPKTQTNNTPDNLSMDEFDELLYKDNASTTSPSNDNDPISGIPASHSNDDLLDLIGADLESLIPEAPANEKNPELIRKKINERIAHPPSQEQLANKRSLTGQLMWGVGILGLLGFMAGQYVFFNIDGLVKAGKANFVSSFCQSCLPSADVGTLTTSYSLRSGQADFTTDLIGVINNTSTTAQLYPNLKITVTGQHGLIGDLAVAPKDYLDVPQKLIGASSNGRFMLTLAVPTNEIVSVTIEPFY